VITASVINDGTERNRITAFQIYASRIGPMMEGSAALPVLYRYLLLIFLKG
jgi:hypothetical protein